MSTEHTAATLTASPYRLTAHLPRRAEHLAQRHVVQHAGENHTALMVVTNE